MKKHLALVLVLALVMMLLAGCGGSSASSDSGTSAPAGSSEAAPAGSGAEVQDINLKVWVPEEEMELTKTLCDSFNEAHPEWNITFEISVTGIDESVNSLETDPDLAADVMQIPSGSVNQVVSEGLLLPITYDIDNVRALYSEGAIDSTMAAGPDGNTYTYAIPFSPNSFFMYYNTDLYTEEDVQSLETMMAKDLGDGIQNFSFTFHDSWYIESFFFAAGCTLFGENGIDPTQCDFNSPAGVAAAEYIMDLVKNPKFVEDRDAMAGALFKEGKLGAMCTGTWGLGEESDPTSLISMINNDQIHVAACALPNVTINGKTARLSNFADYKAIAVKSTTAQPLAAQQLAEWLGNADSQLARYKAIACTPTVLSLMGNEEITSDFATAALFAQTEYATAQPNIPQINNYWTPMVNLGEGLLSGDVNSSNVQESLDKVVNDILSSGLGG